MREDIEKRTEIKREEGVEEGIKKTKDKIGEAMRKLAEITPTTSPEEWEPDFRKFLEGSK